MFFFFFKCSTKPSSAKNISYIIKDAILKFLKCFKANFMEWVSVRLTNLSFVFVSPARALYRLFSTHPC